MTGANFLLEFETSKILIDCGLVQGSQFADNLNKAEFSYNPAEVDYLLVTHTHIDHIGRIPKLVKDGFKGQILSTPETRELAELLLADTVRILDSEARHDGTLPLYGIADVNLALSLWNTYPGFSYD